MGIKIENHQIPELGFRVGFFGSMIYVNYHYASCEEESSWARNVKKILFFRKPFLYFVVFESFWFYGLIKEKIMLFKLILFFLLITKFETTIFVHRLDCSS